jgi:hypothetical protein
MSENTAVMNMARQILAEKEQRIEGMREQIATRYPHADPSTLRFDPVANKFAVTIHCTKCDKAREVYTSDLFQVTLCIEHSREAKAKAKAERTILRAQAMELLATGQVK